MNIFKTSTQFICKILNQKNRRLLIGLFLLFSYLLSYWIWLDYRSFIKKPIDFNQLQQPFVLAKGSGVNRLANQLQKGGYIDSTHYLKLLAWLTPEYKQLKAGEYKLSGLIKPKKLLKILTQGQVIHYSFTIIEGQTFHQIALLLNQEPRLAPLKNEEIQLLLNGITAKPNHLEGWLFPETYFFTQGESAYSLLKRSITDMQLELQKQWRDKDKNLPYKNAYQALIMASIIEKETGIKSEMSQISGVFVRRLQKRMRLQTDPTVIYGIGPEFNGDITRKDLKTPTPYNTYTIRGLPPTPIAMPSKEAIYAALHPDASKTLYFVADGTGGHYFSETLKEHQQAVNRMLRRNKKKNQLNQ